MKLRYFWPTLLSAIVLAGVAAWVLWRPARQPELDGSHTLAAARRSLERGQHDRALQLAKEVLATKPTSPQALLIAGNASREVPDALYFFDQLPPSDDEEIVAAHVIAGQLHNQIGHASAAVQHMQLALGGDPQNTNAHRELALILTITGRRWESGRHLFSLVKMGQANVEELALLGDLEIDFDDAAEIARYRTAAPEDPVPAIATARSLISKHDRPTEAGKVLQEVVAVNPDLLEAHVWLGWTLVDDAEEFSAWNAKLPDDADQHPMVWVVRGLAASREQPRAAIRCFGEALRRDPNLKIANHHLAQLLTREGESSQAEPFRQRAAKLHALASALMETFPNRNNPRALRQLLPHLHQSAKLCESLGRLWEAAAWYEVIDSLSPGDGSAKQNYLRLRRLISDDLPQTSPDANPANRLDLASYPLPRWKTPTGRSSETFAASDDATVVFEDVTRSAGIDFVYDNGQTPNQEGLPIYQVTGGGVGVIDYDTDGWPDLYLTQGGKWPSAAKESKPTDRLFRNLGNGRFADVTAHAGLGDTRLSQGVAIGDYDSDGFPDIYLANLGQNRLYRNNGDGTFADVSNDAGLNRDDWTTSCLVADLNGDALPDIYDVNYVDYKSCDITQLCSADGIAKRTCPPKVFPDGQDRIYVNTGNGSFEDVTNSSGIVRPQGYGLGIVAADFDGRGPLGLFIANDDTPNFWFVNQSAMPGEKMSFVDRADYAGLAVDRDGHAQACMGVAAGDADGDRKLDLFVTNFYQQSNTLYRRERDWFEDATISAGLRQGGFNMLGFGTQFIDAELDGWPDLIVANGHVDDYSYKGYPFKMRPQYFRNTGAGQFHELSSDSLGSYFRRELLGRGMATLDFNRDGRPDAAISNIGDNLALLANRTSQVGHYVTLRLRGVESNRDAIGSIVKVKAGRRTMMHQLTAGDGYQASNERQLLVGLGSHDNIEELTVQWPSGLSQTFPDIAVDTHWLLIEGADIQRLD